MELLQTGSSAADAGVGIVLLIIYGVVGLAALAWAIYWLMDVLKQPDEAWQASGQNKQLWIALWVIGCCVGINVIVGLIYWFAIRPKLQGPASGAPTGYAG